MKGFWDALDVGRVDVDRADVGLVDVGQVDVGRVDVVVYKEHKLESEAKS